MTLAHWAAAAPLAVRPLVRQAARVQDRATEPGGLRRSRSVQVRAGLSTSPDTHEAVRAAAAEVEGHVDLAFLFLSRAHADLAEEAAEVALEALRPAHLVGCVAEGVIAGGCEVEEGPAVAVWAARLPGATLEPFHASAVETGHGIVVAGFPPDCEAAMVAMLVDPFTFPSAPFLSRLNVHRPGLPVVGGLALGGEGPGEQTLILDGEVHDGGAVGVAVSGVPVLTVVSQGCAPFGREAVVTSADGSLVYELAGEPALHRLRTELEQLTIDEQQLASRGIFAGLVIDENRAEYRRGDFLMRSVLGADEESGALAVGDDVRVGQTLRFHMRDERCADEDLREALTVSLAGGVPAGALLFTCNGRGSRMFEEPDHDATVVGEAVGSDAVAGFFCGGEIGPVGGRTFLHGYTATLAVFLQPD
jgi:small ligand-binding sensory domain FIST